MDGTTLLRAWQRQLVREHRHICWYYRVELPTPLFEISEGTCQAGSWTPKPEPGIIGIAGGLIREHSWEVVLEVLKHEICHQYVAHNFPGHREPPHGPAFHLACEFLGVHPAFRRATGEIPRLLKTDAAAPSAIMARVEKLLALATSANEHEAALAMSKAGELMRKHNLDRLAGPQPPAADDYDYLVIDSGRERRAPHHNHLVAILRDFFYVKTVSYQLYQPAADRHHRVLELLGARENLLVAEYVYHFLEGQLARLWHHYRRANRGRVTGREKNSYYIGILNGLREKLRAGEPPATGRRAPAAARQTAAQPLTCSQLVCADDYGLQHFHDLRFPRLRTTRGRGVRLHDSSYQAGQREGRRLTIHKGLHHRDGDRGKLLE